jgi:guanine nucleotide-binding protein G(i) subunit alpha
MGAACFKQAPESHVIAEKILKDGKKKMQNEVKLLLLGAGDSGKSTIAKQMRIIHKQSWSPEETLEYRDIVRDNILAAMLSIIYGASKYNYAISTELQQIAEPLTSTFPQRATRDVSLLEENHIEVLKQLWEDKSIQNIYKTHGGRLQLPSSTSYFMNQMDRIFEKNYTPIEQDILRARRSTTGVHEIEFNIQNITFKCVDVGGQRTERRKWLHVFDDVTAVLFCVALDEYDLRMYEDETVWRVHESLQLFNEIANSTHLSGSAIILFMNKKDLFEQKIKEVDLTVTFPEYAGGKDYAKASEYLTVQFCSLMKQRERLYTHLTCATDTENIKFVFGAIKDMLLNKMLDQAL